MPHVTANGLKIAYDETGHGQPIVLIMGIGAQRVLWPDPLVDRLAASGFRVVRPDNRDVGESEWLDHLGVPNIPSLVGRRLLGREVQAPYTLSDMAADVVGLLDALHLDRAHLVGASMGGMIAQTVAIEHPARVASLTSIMSHGGERRALLSDPRALRSLLQPAPKDREGYVLALLTTLRAIHGTGLPFDEAAYRVYAERQFDRGVHPAGFARQLAAILASGDRHPALQRICAPTLVVHGEQDPLVRPAAGERVARRIPGARWHLIPKMGHTFPEPIHAELAALVRDHVRGAVESAGESPAEV